MNIRTVVLWLACLLPGAVLAAGAGGPNYAGYPAAPYVGPVAKPDLSGKKARLFSQAINQQIAGGPNFAGHYRLTAWGCGTGCMGWAVVDAKSGKVWFPPFTVEAGDCATGRCDYSLEYRFDSELVVVRGMLNGEGRDATRYYRWHEGQLVDVNTPEMAAVEAAPVPLVLPEGRHEYGGAP